MTAMKTFTDHKFLSYAAAVSLCLTVGVGGDVDGLPRGPLQTQRRDPVEGHHGKAVGGVRSKSPNAHAAALDPSLGGPIIHTVPAWRAGAPGGQAHSTLHAVGEVPAAPAV